MDPPFTYGPAEVFIACELGEADALRLEEGGEVEGFKLLGVTKIEYDQGA